MMRESIEIDRRLRWMCAVLWIVVSLPVILQPGSDGMRIAVWSSGSIVFGLAMWLGFSPRLSRVSRVGAAVVQVAAVIAMVLTLCDGLEGFLLGIVALQLAMLFGDRVAQTWIVVQSLCLFAAIWFHWSLRPAFFLSPPYLGLQLLAYWCARVLLREMELRRRLEGVVIELHATRELLAENARSAERSRITDELHDVVGHRLVALRLNLEALSSHVSAPALDNARSLIGEVHDDVQSMVHLRRNSRGIDLNRVIEAMAAAIPRPKVHVKADNLKTAEPEAAEVLLRCCLEAVTNSVKHSRATNLWIELHQQDGQVEFSARDDGRGANKIKPGHGLDRMRRQLREVGGTLAVDTAVGSGFSLVATLPAKSQTT